MLTNMQPPKLESNEGARQFKDNTAKASASGKLRRRPSALQPDCACSLARRAARSVTQLYDVVLAPVGVKATQFVLLRAISNSGQVAQWQLASDLSIAVETLTRRLARIRHGRPRMPMKKLAELPTPERAAASNP